MIKLDILKELPTVWEEIPLIRGKLHYISDYVKKADLLLLGLCILATAFGMVVIASATSHEGGNYLIIQGAALILGIGLFVLFSLIDLDVLSGMWKILLAFSVVLILLLKPFGVEGNTGNKAWLRFGSIGVQPAEVVKIPFVILLSNLIVHMKNTRGINKPLSVVAAAGFTLALVGLIVAISSDLGSGLVYVFIFIVLMYAAGLHILWIMFGVGAVTLMFPFLWNHFFSEYQKNRILAPYDPTVDPSGLGITWQTNQSKNAISGGGFLGQGLFKGNYTQSGGVTQQHTDFVFSAIGEELGFVGAMVVILLLTLIIVRCIRNGVRSHDPAGTLVCIGIGAMLIFQTFENVGMCIGLTPVIGLTLPFISYGGSSIVVLYAAMGIVCGVRMRPKPSSFVTQY